MSSRVSLRQLARRLWKEHATPGRLGLAVAVGVVVGCSPFFGLHFWIGLLIAVLLRLNKIAVFLGSQISIPPLAPLVGYASVQVGSLLLQGRTVQLTLDDFALGRLPDLIGMFLSSWLVGGLVVGTLLGAVAWGLTTLVIHHVRRQPSKSVMEQEDGQWSRDLRRAIARYASTPRKHRHYARFKYRMDPVYRQVCQLVGDSVERIVDLGTGLGMLPVLLALRGQGQQITGVDWDGAKISSGQTASSGLARVELLEKDIRDYQIPAADVVVLVDVLHYWPRATQRALLERAGSALRPGGRLIIRETERKGRALFTRLLEAAALRIGWNRGSGGTSYVTRQELLDELAGLGLSCCVDEASSPVHQGNMLVWGQRPT